MRWRPKATTSSSPSVPLMGDATAMKAKQYPDIKFAIVDHAYSDGGLANVTSLMFAEDQVGFLAGVLPSCMARPCSLGRIFIASMAG